jgi:hypothetical protein
VDAAGTKGAQHQTAADLDCLRTTLALVSDNAGVAITPHLVLNRGESTSLGCGGILQEDKPSHQVSHQSKNRLAALEAAAAAYPDKRLDLLLLQTGDGDACSQERAAALLQREWGQECDSCCRVISIIAQTSHHHETAAP